MNKILYEEENFSVSRCNECGRTNLFFNNIIVTFNSQDFDDFISGIDRVDFFQDSVVFPDRTAKVILKTCHKNIQFCLEEEEFNRLKNMLNQVGLLLEANKLIN